MEYLASVTGALTVGLFVWSFLTNSRQTKPTMDVYRGETPRAASFRKYVRSLRD